MAYTVVLHVCGKVISILSVSFLCQPFITLWNLKNFIHTIPLLIISGVYVKDSAVCVIYITKHIIIDVHHWNSTFHLTASVYTAHNNAGMTNLWRVDSLLLVLCMVSTDTKDTNFGSMLYAIFCSIFRSLSSVSSAVHSPVTGPIETYTLLLCGVWVGVLVIRGKYRESKMRDFKGQMLASVHGLLYNIIMNLLCSSDRHNM